MEIFLRLSLTMTCNPLLIASYFQPELIRSYGYPAEEHFITTSDGYILAIHRIPHGVKEGVESKGPVFLGHCLVGSSAIWSFGPTNFSLAYLLADAGKNS